MTSILQRAKAKNLHAPLRLAPPRQVFGMRQGSAWGWLVPLIAVLVWCQPLSAYDPRLDWQTLAAPHFRVHYPAGRYHAAARLAAAGERAFSELTRRLGWVPTSPVHVVVDDTTDRANGSARSLPYNLITVNLVTPDARSELSDFQNWLYELMVHELTHIVHLDTVRGLPKIINTVLGRQLAPNGMQPRWFIEGLATRYESTLTGGGRLGSAFYDMILRMAVLAGEPMRLDEISGAPLRWPQGTAQYLYGAYFVDYLAERFGEDVLRQISQDYAGRLVPYGVNASLEAVTQRRYPELYADFIGELRRRFTSQRREIESKGHAEGKQLTELGQWVGPARLHTDGTIYFVHQGTGEHAVLKALTSTASKPRTVGWVQPGAQIALVPDADHILVAQRELHGVYRLYGDLFRVDLATGKRTRLTAGARIRGPDVSPDGRWVTFAQNRGQRSVLCRAPRERLTALRRVVALGPRGQVWTPRYGPEGKTIVFSGFRDGQRDIYAVGSDGQGLRQLTDDRAIDGGPVIGPDGRWVYFHSNRDGVFNLYAVPQQGGVVRRLTRVFGGAFNPQPEADGDAVVYERYGPRGFDLARISVNLDAAERAPPSTYRTGPTARATRLGPPPSYPSRSYMPFTTLWPRAWLPWVGQDPGGLALGALVSGRDAVAEHNYQLQAGYGIQSRFPSFAFSYGNGQFHPGARVSGSRQLQFAPVAQQASDPVRERVWRAAVGTRLPLVRQRDVSLSLGVDYSLAWRQRLGAQNAAAGRSRRFSRLRLGLRFSNALRYIDSISFEEGGRLDLRLNVEHPLLGSEFQSITTSLTGRYYLENPWVQRHVLAAEAGFKYGWSNYRQRRLFSIGGAGIQNPLPVLARGRLSAGGGGLRGFPLAPLVGNALVEAHLEYRLPLWDLQRGVATLPFFARTLHMAAFLDGAAIADTLGELGQRQFYSAGAELRLNLLLGHYLPLTARFGYGHGLRPDDVQRFFFVLGSSF